MLRSPHSRMLVWLSFTGACLFTSLAHAQTDDATRAAARSLGYEGIADFEAGSFAAAADKLDRAYRALRVPSLGLWSARALEKQGKLVAAAERYLEVQRLDPGSGDVAVQKQAQADAGNEHAALVPRIPNVIIQVEGVPAQDVTLRANGADVPSSLIGAKLPVDPGNVTFEARYGEQRAREQVALKEGETRTIALRFVATADGTPAAVVPAATVPPGAASQPPVEERTVEQSQSGSGTRTLGFVAVSVGGAAIVAGAVTGGIAMAKRDSIEGCEGSRCPPSADSDVAAYNDLRAVSSLCFIGGGVLAATGVVLFLVAPRSSAPPAARNVPSWSLSPWLGAGTTGLILEARR